MKISRQTREIINIVIFVLVVAALVLTYVVYPLSRTKAIMARPGVDEFQEDSTVVNDPATWVQAGLLVDTMTIETDGLTKVACLYVWPTGDASADSTTIPPSDDSLKGTAILLHPDGTGRDHMLDLARAFLQEGFSVAVYDQRAAGLSCGYYRGEGQYESNDLLAVTAYLDLRGKITHPLVVVGFETGGDAALLAALEEKRIDLVASVSPYLSTRRMQDVLKERYDTYWFPFYRTIMWFWYNIRSSYAASYRDLEQIQAVAGPTLVMADTQAIQSDEYSRLVELSKPDLLSMHQLPTEPARLFDEIIEFTKASATR
ncbi:MAG: hypothetical protein ABIE70_02245 [bacterium]